MVQTGIKGVRAAWLDAQEQLAREHSAIDYLPGDEAWGYHAGQWEGAPYHKLPPNCPVKPLGSMGKVLFFSNSAGEVLDIPVRELTRPMLLHLFGNMPSYLQHHWPRWNAPKKDEPFRINGLEVEDVMKCLIHVAHQRPAFSLNDSVRGRGAWRTESGELIWHAGDRLYRVDGKRLVSSAPGEVDGVFYTLRPPVTRPWHEPVPFNDSPAQGIFKMLCSWTWERPAFDPVLVLGWIGCAFLGGALPWRPHLFTVGDMRVGKSSLQLFIKEILGKALLRTVNTTAAGIYQHVRQDSLPVAVDELEASADNRKVTSILDLARTASSEDGMIFRGGANHEGVEFAMQNAFYFAAINPPPMEPADRSRMAMVNLQRLQLKDNADRPVVREDIDGRMILRALMDAWPRFPKCFDDWRQALFLGGLDRRAQDTFGTLLAVANLLLGDEAMEDAGFPIDNDKALGGLVAKTTMSDREDGSDNWRLCLEYLLGQTIEAWKSGEKPMIGAVLDKWETDQGWSTDATNERLHLVGLHARLEDRHGKAVKDGDAWTSKLLCVPLQGVQLGRMFAGSKWSGGGWGTALKQAPADVVIRDRGNGQNVKINRVPSRCLFVDMAAYDRAVSKGGDE